MSIKSHAEALAVETGGDPYAKGNMTMAYFTSCKEMSDLRMRHSPIEMFADELQDYSRGHPGIFAASGTHAT